MSQFPLWRWEMWGVSTPAWHNASLQTAMVSVLPPGHILENTTSVPSTTIIPFYCVSVILLSQEFHSTYSTELPASSLQLHFHVSRIRPNSLPLCQTLRKEWTWSEDLYHRQEPWTFGRHSTLLFFWRHPSLSLDFNPSVLDRLIRYLLYALVVESLPKHQLPR
jgi:hypothetical protein